jgi:HEPN domain-containing protein
MNRLQLHQLAEERVRDAEALLAAGQWSGSYYLAGYAVECGLKACIAKLTNEHDFPDKDRATRSYTHKIEDLVKVAGLAPQCDFDRKANLAFDINWLVAKDWEEKARYEIWTESEARKLFLAVSDATDGVLPWIKARW